MPESKNKRRVVKKSETVREKRAKQVGVEPKQRRAKRVISRATKPLRVLSVQLISLIKPFRFLLRPFKTKVARFIGRNVYKIFGLKYLVESWKELRMVVWPSRSETAKLTIAVFIFAFLIAGFVAILDVGLDKVFRQLLT